MPKIELAGVYQLPITDQMIAEQTELVYGADAPVEPVSQIREQLASTVLIEVLVSDADDSFDISDFTQQNENLTRENWQVAWAEAFLSSDGQTLVVERGEERPRDLTSFRVAFYFHDYNPGTPVLSSYGTMPSLPRQPMPERLEQLVPYELLD